MINFFKIICSNKIKKNSLTFQLRIYLSKKNQKKLHTRFSKMKEKMKERKRKVLKTDHSTISTSDYDIIKGDFNTITVGHVTVKGDFNTIEGDHVHVEGDHNTITGKHATIKGDFNSTTGYGSKIKKGSFNNNNNNNNNNNGGSIGLVNDFVTNSSFAGNQVISVNQSNSGNNWFSVYNTPSEEVKIGAKKISYNGKLYSVDRFPKFTGTCMSGGKVCMDKTPIKKYVDLLEKEDKQIEEDIKKEKEKKKKLKDDEKKKNDARVKHLEEMNDLLMKFINEGEELDIEKLNEDPEFKQLLDENCEKFKTLKRRKVEKE